MDPTEGPWSLFPWLPKLPFTLRLTIQVLLPSQLRYFADEDLSNCRGRMDLREMEPREGVTAPSA